MAKDEENKMAKLVEAEKRITETDDEYDLLILTRKVYALRRELGLPMAD